MKVRTRIVLVITMIAALLAGASGGAGAQSAEEEHHSEDHHHEDIAVSAEAIALANSRELSQARSNWDDKEIDFTDQVGYQLEFRAQVDYMPATPEHIGRVLNDRPINAGYERLALFLTDAEAAEFERREALGDNIDEMLNLLGETEDDEGKGYSANFGGIWQDQHDGGAIVVSFVDASGVDGEALARIVGGSEHLRVIEVDHSWNEINEFRDSLLDAFQSQKIEGAVLINIGSEGRKIEVVTPTPDRVSEIASGIAPKGLVSVVEGPGDSTMTGPSATHNEPNQHAGLQIELDPGGNCTWGANGHTSSYNYLVSAGHCGTDNFNGFTTSGNNIHQNNSFHLTPGQQYLWSRYAGDGWDMMRMSTPQADNNCYHAAGNCKKYIRWFAEHNSWELGSDVVCASRGSSNGYKCGFILEENYPSSGECEGDRWVRWSGLYLDGDSGSGAIGTYPNTQASIDAIASCKGGTTLATGYAFGNTASDVRTFLGFDFNCASSKKLNQGPAWWAPCPDINR